MVGQNLLCARAYPVAQGSLDAARGHINYSRMHDTPLLPQEPSAVASSPGVAFLCPNCGRENSGDYCAGCGQKRLHEGDLSLGHAWHHVVDEVFHLDGKILVSLKLLFTRPGQLTLDFLEGRRVRHVHPIQLFLFISAAYFLFASVSLDLREVFPKDRTPPQLMDKFAARAAKTGVTLDEYLVQRNARIAPPFKVIFITIIMLNGVWLRLLFRKHRRYLAEHMVMALHLSCFGMTVAFTLGWLRVFHVNPWITTPLMLGIAFTYYLLACRRVYGEGWGLLVGKVLALQGISTMIGVTAITATIFRVLLH